MARIPLIIADEDTDFLGSLSNYLLEDYGNMFEVHTFSRAEYLDSYLTEQERTGLLLISPTMLQSDSVQQSGLVRILFTSEPNQADSEPRQVFKYLSGPELVKNILQILSESEDALGTDITTNKTKVVAIYSPAGGVGKTTIALGCALQTAWEGKKVFYLNLESLPSTDLFFQSILEEGLSTVLFCLREKKKNLGLKIKALINTDQGSQIHYFAPTESGLELNEETAAALPELMGFLRSSCDYDFIYVDLGNQINTYYMSALDASDAVLLINTPEPVCRLKVGLFEAELKRWASRQKSTVSERVYPLYNKWEEGSERELELELKGLNSLNSPEPLVKLPLVKELLLIQGSRYRIDLNGKFGTALYQIRAGLQDSFGG